MTLKGGEIEQQLIDRLVDLKYTYRPDIRDKAALEQNFRARFKALNQARLTDAELARLRDDIITADVFQAAKRLREYGYFQREGKPAIDPPAADANPAAAKKAKPTRSQAVSQRAVVDAILDKHDAATNQRRFNLSEFDLYYEDVQQCIKDQQYPNSDVPHRNKIDVTIVVDMLLTGFDSKYLNSLYSSALIDYDYIMGLVARYSQEEPGKQTISRDQLVSLLSSSSNLLDERDEIIAYIDTLEAGQGHGRIEEIKGDYQLFSAQKARAELDALADQHGLPREALHGFVDRVLDGLIFDGEQLSDLFAPLALGWKARSKAELALMVDLLPLLKKPAGVREISGLAAYE